MVEPSAIAALAAQVSMPVQGQVTIPAAMPIHAVPTPAHLAVGVQGIPVAHTMSTMQAQLQAHVGVGAKREAEMGHRGVEKYELGEAMMLTATDKVAAKAYMAARVKAVSGGTVGQALGTKVGSSCALPWLTAVVDRC